MKSRRLPGRPLKLNDAQIAEAHRLRADGMTYSGIANRLGCHRQTLHKALRYRHSGDDDRQPGGDLGGGNRPSEPAPVLSLSQIRDLWALDRADDSGWWPPTAGFGVPDARASEYLDRVDPLR